MMITSCATVRIDSDRYPVIDFTGDDPMECLCDSCMNEGHWLIIGEVSQLGLAEDCHVLLCQCLNCNHQRGIRYFLSHEGVTE